MIERLLAADAALERGELDLAERVFGQVAEADARNAIAVVGLARVAHGRGDLEAARTWLRHALEIDPQEAAARRLLAQLDMALAEAAAGPATRPASLDRSAGVAAPAPVESPVSTPRRSLLDRLRRWLGLAR